jgi:hypothetical protein
MSEPSTPPEPITVERILASWDKMSLFPEEQRDPKAMSILWSCRTRMLTKGNLTPRQADAFLKIEQVALGNAPPRPRSTRKLYDVLVKVSTPTGTMRWHTIGSGVDTQPEPGISVKLFSVPLNWDGSFVIKPQDK